MNAVRMRLFFELRERWRSWLGLAVLIGLAAGVAGAAAAGARRTESAYPRLVQASVPYDLTTGGFPSDVDPDRALALISSMPEVQDWTRIDVAAYTAVLASGRVVPAPQLIAATDLSGQLGTRLGRFKILSGRLADIDASDEAVVGFATAERFGIHLGSSVAFVVGDPDAKPRRLSTVHIVGIIAMPAEFPAVGVSSAFGSVLVTPAFVRANHINPASVDATLLIRLRRGPADTVAFIQHLAAAGLSHVDIPYRQPLQTAAVQRTIRFESQALWLLCALIAAAAFVLFGQSLAGQTVWQSAGFPTLRALGMSRAQLFALGLARATLIGVLAAFVAVGTALCLSPLAPIGLARIAEPHPGLALDAVALSLTALTTVLLTTIATALPAWNAAFRRPAPLSGSPGTAGRPWAGPPRWVWISPSAALGVRIAFDTSRGRTAAPVRSGVLGTTLSVAAVTASLVFAGSLGHLLDTPRLAGFTWDAFISGESSSASTAAAALRAHPLVAGYDRGGFDNVRIGTVAVTALVTDGSGSAGPVVTAGKAPVASDEVALGTRTMRSAGVAIGRTVDVVPDEAGGHARRPVRMRVVGTVIVPPNPFQATILGEGAAFTPQGYQRLRPAAARDLPFLVRFVPGVDRDAALASLTAVLKDVPNLFVVGAERPAKVTSLAGIAAVPILLSALLTIIAVGTLVHTLVRSIGAWQRDLAVLRSIGFIRRQLRAIFCWQATALATVALLIGVPTGIAAGRWGWTAFAMQLGVLPEPVVPLSTLLIAVPCTLLLANLIALLPGRAAVRTGTAAILRNE